MAEEKGSTMKKHVDDFEIVTKDHGGYKAGMCCLCGRDGWIGEIKHRVNCPVRIARRNQKSTLEVKVVL